MVKTILYGICGIGNGHYYRQLPIILELLKNPDIQIIFFAYKNSLSLLREMFQNNANVKIIEVNVPYYKGDERGLNFSQTAGLNQNFNFDINFQAFSQVEKLVHQIDLVISDYEPFSAQLGYAFDCPVVTIDQQSKFFTKNTPAIISGTTCRDEIMRLGMFFPKATRLACSFFEVEPAHDVQIFPPIFRPELKNTKIKVLPGKFLVYISAQEGFHQPIENLLESLKTFTEANFDVYLKNAHPVEFENIKVHPHGCSSFDLNLANCSGVIATAGHSLLSECMYLEKPVYAMPLDLYEQQLNAKVIDDNCLGLKNTTFSVQTFEKFTEFLEMYRYNIQHSTALKRGDGLEQILDVLFTQLYKD